MLIKKDHSTIILLLIIQLKFNFITILSEISECPKETPIDISNNCTMQYCTKDDFSSGKCKIKNEIIKTQWLNNIIVIGDLYYRYINFASYSNGDLVIQTTSFPASTYRKFYGLKENGRPFFTNNNQETPYFTKEIPEDYYGILESESLIVKTSSDGKEYFFCASKLECYAEMINLRNNDDYVYKSSVGNFAGITDVKSLRHASISLSNIANNYYYIFAFIGSDSSYIDKIYLRKYIFTTSSSFFQYSTSITIENPIGKMISCFETKNNLIICFYMTKVHEEIYSGFYVDSSYFNLVKYSIDLSDDKLYSFELNYEDQNSFYKCIHLKDEVGVFAYYNYLTDILQPILLFKQFNNNNFEDYLPYNNSLIILNLLDATNNILLNDIIRINEKKICFSTTSLNKETI